MNSRKQIDWAALVKKPLKRVPYQFLDNKYNYDQLLIDVKSVKLCSIDADDYIYDNIIDKEIDPWFLILIDCEFGFMDVITDGTIYYISNSRSLSPLNSQGLYLDSHLVGPDDSNRCGVRLYLADRDCIREQIAIHIKELAL